MRRPLAFVSMLLFLTVGASWGQGTSTQRNPVVTFNTPGVHSVTLQVCNAVGCTDVTKSVVVLDPMPKIGSLTLPYLTGAGAPATLAAVTTGRPPLTHTWTVSLAGVDLATVTGNPAAWTPPLGTALYQVRLVVQNADGTANGTATLNVVPSSFADVPPTHWAWNPIEILFARGISGGCGGEPRRYCPDSVVTRAQMAVFLLAAKEGSTYSPPACVTPRFDDVPCTHPLAAWINELAARGVTGGCGNGNYCPTNAVTREQMAVFLLATKEGSGYTPPATCLTAPFLDVPCYSVFAPWIKELVARGVTAGCGNSRYCPTNSVTRAQMAVFLTSTFGLTMPPSTP